jgi:hypothetical protein
LFFIFAVKSKTDNSMKKILAFCSTLILLFLLISCNKQSDEETQYEFSITTYTNPTDPTLLLVTYEDGTQVTYSGTKDATGNPVNIHHVTVKFADMEGEFLVTLGDNMLPAKQLTPNGTVFEYIWNNDSTMRLIAVSPDGSVQVSVPVDLTGTKSFQSGWSTEPQENIRKDLPAKFGFKEYQPGASAPLKPAGDNAMIFHVMKCGVDVSNATVVLKVTPPLGVSSFPCAYIGNGFYSTNIPKSGEPPANYEQQCDKVGEIAKDVCALYNMISILPGSVSVQVC